MGKQIVDQAAVHEMHRKRKFLEEESRAEETFLFDLGSFYQHCLVS